MGEKIIENSQKASTLTSSLFALELLQNNSPHIIRFGFVLMGK
jgi:hypothetical protein